MTSFFPPWRSPKGISPWLAAAPYGIFLALGASLAALMFAPGASFRDALVIAGLLCLPLTILTTLARIARDDTLYEGDEQKTVPLAFATSTATLLLLPGLLLLGSFLKATTHHRALGGVTFAVVALGMVVGTVVIGARVGAMVRRGLLRRATSAVLTVLVLLAALLVFWMLHRAGWLRPQRLDVLLLLLAPALGAFAPPVRSRETALGAWAASFLFAGISFFALARQPAGPATLPLARGALATEIFSAVELFSEGKTPPADLMLPPDGRPE